MRDTDSDWARVAAEHPYWGVLSAEQFRGQELSPEARAEFFATGERLIADILGFVRRHVDPEFQPRRALDFGCGVGRLLIPLAQMSQEAVGVDIAPRMLELARENLRRAGLSNGTAVPSDDSLSRVEGRFNFVNSYIVLQHIPPERGYRIIAQMLRRLEVKGVFSLQLTFAKERRFFPHERGKARYYRREGNALFDLALAEGAPPEGTITMFDYDLNHLFVLAMQVCGSPALVLPTDHDGHLGVHLIGQKVREAA